MCLCVVCVCVCVCVLVYLSSFGVFTDEGLVKGGEGWWVVIDIQDFDGHRHTADLVQVVWEMTEAVSMQP